MNGQLNIDTMYAFVVRDTDGTEGIPALMQDSGMMMPLVGADMAMVEKLRPHAEMFARIQGVTVELVHFTTRTHVEWIEA